MSAPPSALSNHRSCPDPVNINQLPTELLTLIFARLSFHDLFKGVKFTCRQWYDIVLDPKMMGSLKERLEFEPQFFLFKNRILSIRELWLKKFTVRKLESLFLPKLSPRTLWNNRLVTTLETIFPNLPVSFQWKEDDKDGSLAHLHLIATNQKIECLAPWGNQIAVVSKLLTPPLNVTSIKVNVWNEQCVSTKATTVNLPIEYRLESVILKVWQGNLLLIANTCSHASHPTARIMSWDKDGIDLFSHSLFSEVTCCEEWGKKLVLAGRLSKFLFIAEGITSLSFEKYPIEKISENVDQIGIEALASCGHSLAFALNDNFNPFAKYIRAICIIDNNFHLVRKITLRGTAIISLSIWHSYLLSYCADTTLHVWDQEGSCIRIFQYPFDPEAYPITSPLTLFPDGKLITTLAQDLYLWEPHHSVDPTSLAPIVL